MTPPIRLLVSLASLALLGCHHQVEVDLNATEPRVTAGLLSKRRTLAVEVRGTTRSLGERHLFFASLPIIFFANHWNYVVNPEQARRKFAEFLREDLTAAGFEVVEARDGPDARLTVTLASTDYYYYSFFKFVYLSVEQRSALLATDCELETGRALHAISLKSFDVADEELPAPAQIAYTWRHNATLVAEAAARQCEEEDAGRLPRAVGTFQPSSERSPNATAWTPLRIGPAEAGPAPTPVATPSGPATPAAAPARPAPLEEPAAAEEPPPAPRVTAPAPAPPAPAASSCDYCGRRVGPGITKCPHCGYQR
jgi:hypothetical protein